MSEKSKINIDLVTGSPLGDLPLIIDSIKAEYGDIINIRIFPVPLIDSGKMDDNDAYRHLLESDIVLYDVRGNGKTFQMLKRLYDISSVNMCTIMGGSPDILGLTRIGSFSIKELSEKTGGQAQVDYTRIKQLGAMVDKLGAILSEDAVADARNWVNAITYWTSPHEKNLKNLLLMMAKEYGLEKLDPIPRLNIKVAPPIEKPDYGIYHPAIDVLYEDLEEYLNAYGYDPSKPSVGILYYGNVHYDVSIVGVKALLEHLEPHVNVIPVFTGGVQNIAPMKKYFMSEKAPLDAIISIIWFRINGGPMGGDQSKTIDMLSTIDAPVFTPITMYSGDIKEWKESKNGANGIEVLATVVFPETDGAIEPIPIFGLEPIPGYGEVRMAKAIDDRVKKIAERVLRRISLRYKENKDKKVAFIMYDYPPGEANIGGAAYLDTFKSFEAVLDRLRAEGYDADALNVKESVLSLGAINSPEFIQNRVEKLVRVPLKDYLSWYSTLPEAMRKDIEKDWGAPPGKLMVRDGDIILPIIKKGNTLICIQPSRGKHEDRSKAYHDKYLTPHHQYIAFYFWLDRGYKADAVVHVGTHGTIEFMPGKEVGLSSECYPDILMGTVPHFYFYHVTNPSEAVIAKRRVYGTLIDYAPPSFTNSGLYGELLELEDMVNVLLDATVVDSIKEVTLKNVKEKCKKLGMEFTSIEDLHEELTSMKSSIIPRGLHTLGETYSRESLERLLLFILGRDNPEAPSLTAAIAKAAGHQDITDAVKEQAEGLALELIREACIDGDELEVEGDVSKALEFGRSLVEKIMASDEIGSLVHGLNGGYIRPNISGDPIRSPEVFPTGMNSYQFDPKLIPTQAAFERGMQIAENTINGFYRENGRYPETVGMILWGFETAKTRGETVGQILAYLGLKVIHGKSWYPSLQVIPLEELGRPRIDVNINICGFFRDMFPNVIMTLSKGILKIAALDEDVSMNYVRKHSIVMREKLGNINDETAKKLSCARIFGPASGEYGTNLPSIIETSNWEEESQLAEQYADNMSHIYSVGMSGVRNMDVFRSVLDTTEMVSQVRDSHEYEVADLDHYYEFLGGLAKSAEHNNGKKPKILVSDTTYEKIKTMDASIAVTRGTYTRLLNPEWINGMLEHDFHGAKKVADRVEYLIGFAATVGVKSEVFQNVTENLMFNEDLLKALKKNNPFATREISRRLMEAEKRKYWNASPEDLKRLQEIYLRIEEEIESSIE